MRFSIHRRKSVLCLFVLITSILAFLFAGCEPVSLPHDSSSERVVIAVSGTPLSSPFFIAEAKDFFKKEGVAVEINECIGGHRCLSEMLEGRADMSTASELPFMFNSFKRNDYVLISTFVRSHNDVKVIARKDRGIKSGRDLRGKRVGVTIGTSGHFFLEIFLLNNEVAPSEIELVHLEPEDIARALADAEVDAISAWEPFGYNALTLMNNNALVLPNEHIYDETFNLIAARQFTQSGPESIKAVLRALDRACLFMISNSAESQAIITGRLDMDKGFIEWIWPHFMFELSLDQSFIITLEDEARWAIKNNMVDKQTIPNYLKYIYFDALEAIKPWVITIIH